MMKILELNRTQMTSHEHLAAIKTGRFNDGLLEIAKWQHSGLVWWLTHFSHSKKIARVISEGILHEVCMFLSQSLSPGAQFFLKKINNRLIWLAGDSKHLLGSTFGGGSVLGCPKIQTQ